MQPGTVVLGNRNDYELNEQIINNSNTDLIDEHIKSTKHNTTTH